MPDDGQPVVYMYYMGVNNLTADWSDDLKEQLLKYEALVAKVVTRIG